MVRNQRNESGNGNPDSNGTMALNGPIPRSPLPGSVASSPDSEPVLTPSESSATPPRTEVLPTPAPNPSSSPRSNIPAPSEDTATLLVSGTRSVLVQMTDLNTDLVTQGACVIGIQPFRRDRRQGSPSAAIVGTRSRARPTSSSYRHLQSPIALKQHLARGLGGSGFYQQVRLGYEEKR
jgi:hypothetical protein